MNLMLSQNMKLLCGENEGQGVLADGPSHHNIGAHARMMHKLQTRGHLQFMRFSGMSDATLFLLLHM